MIWMFGVRSLIIGLRAGDRVEVISIAAHMTVLCAGRAVAEITRSARRAGKGQTRIHSAIQWSDGPHRGLAAIEE